jgi:hypothetical protein
MAQASPMTAEEILRLDAYCRARFVELVPNQNSFGHFEQWLKHPEYRHLAECPDGFEYPWGGRSTSGSVLKPNRQELGEALRLGWLTDVDQTLLAARIHLARSLGCASVHSWSARGSHSHQNLEQAGLRTLRTSLTLRLPPES